MTKGASGYGRSCRNCAKVKCRCARTRGEGESCDRCHRLNKTCIPVSSVRNLHRSGNDHEQVSPDASLSNAIGWASNQFPGNTHTPPSNLSADIPANLPTGPENYGLFTPAESHVTYSPSSIPPLTHDEETRSHAEQSTPTTRSPGCDPSTIFPCRGEPSAIQAEEYFARFRASMLRFFPVYHLPDMTTSSQLREERPFLWLCVMCVACSSTSQQLALGDSIKGIVSREIVYKGEKNIDLLLGLLTFLAWAHYQAHYMSLITDLTQLAMSIVFDLGLNKAAREPRGHISFKTATKNKPASERPTTPPQKPKTSEERRAVLGCFLLSSLFACTLKRLDSLRWTPDMDHSLALLSNQPECPGDIVLATQVKLQMLTDQLSRSHCTWPFGDGLYSQSQEDTSPFYADTLLNQLGKIREQIPEGFTSNGVMMGHFHTTSLIVNERFLAKPREATYIPNIERVNRFDACMHSIKAWFDILFTVSTTDYVGFTLMFLCSMAYNLLTLVRFSTTKDPTWDEGAVRRSIDVLSICDKLAGNFESIARSRRNVDSSENKFFSDSASILRFMEATWRREMDMPRGEDSTPTLQSLDDLSLPYNFTVDPMQPLFLMDMLWQ
ncbi:hypothetical protein GGR53DRAFT_487022 [Hypoxylon sp. FL1150]|nr:hypothetical protein GGR53DRAFT_487022 [Hypoxylon sp. FL1150]